jgi:cytochrome c2
LVVAVTLSLFAAACTDRAQEEQAIAQAMTGGNAARGAAAIARYGCGSCHIIPGVSGASGLVGPPLSGIGSRTYVAGVLQNTPPNMIRWIENPPAVDEHTVMPALGVTHQDAIDIAGYLYTLK